VVCFTFDLIEGGISTTHEYGSHIEDFVLYLLTFFPTFLNSDNESSSRKQELQGTGRTARR
jgi:hypothetical protein